MASKAHCGAILYYLQTAMHDHDPALIKFAAYRIYDWLLSPCGHDNTSPDTRHWNDGARQGSAN